MIQKTNNCLGCGAVLQTEDSNKVGYVKDLSQPFCRDCFQLMHYGVGESHHHPDSLPEFNKNSLILVVVSVFYIDSIFRMNVTNKHESLHVTYIINQMDLLPPHTNIDKMMENILKQAKSFNLTYDDFILMSAKNKTDINNLSQYIKIRNFKDVYLIGLQNSGKTTIFKALTGNKHALAMKKAALTQTILKDHMEDYTIFDTPGLYQKGFLHEFFDYEIYKDLLPSKTLKPRNGHLGTHDALLIHGLCGIAVLKGETTSIFYGADIIKLHVTNMDKVLTQLINKKLFDISMDSYIQTDLSLKEKVKYQITLADFGLLHIVGPVTIRLFHHKDFHYSISKAYFK